MSKLTDRFKKGTSFYYSDGATYEVWGKVLRKTYSSINTANIVFYKEAKQTAKVETETYTLYNLEKLIERADLRIIKESSQRVIRRIFEFK